MRSLPESRLPLAMLTRDSTMHLEFDLVLPDLRQASKWLGGLRDWSEVAMLRCTKGSSKHHKLVRYVGPTVTTSDLHPPGKHGHTYEVFLSVALVDTDSV